jgi:hypothetical protein
MLFALIRVEAAVIRAVVGEDGKGVLKLQNIPLSFLLGSGACSYTDSICLRFGIVPYLWLLGKSSRISC